MFSALNLFSSLFFIVHYVIEAAGYYLVATELAHKTRGGEMMAYFSLP